MPKYIIDTQTKAFSVASLVSSLNLEKKWDVTIEPHVKRRTLAQNATMWKWYTILGNHLGYTKDEMHDIFREMFLPWSETEFYGVKKKKLTSTSDPSFTTTMESEYLSHIDRFAAQELGILLPHGNDDYYEAISNEHR